ncbi:flagellar brake protein [Peribacillus sp. SCS-155]|uniref:flagellar brake protein n=1 Tax=Peribacillus sedimenti TaxID=3115297 RepID=UPI0039060DC3
MIKVGHTLLLEAKYSAKPEQYKAMVVEADHNNIFIDYPINTETGKIAFLLDGIQLKATYFDEEHAVYIFDTEVLGRVKAEIAMVQLALPPIETFVKIQRRQFVRVETPIDSAVHPIFNDFTPFRAITEDISAGGAALRIPLHIDLSNVSNLYIWFALSLKTGEIHYQRIKCKVIRISEHTDRFNKLSVQFLEMSEGDRQALIRVIFERQLDMKKKGIGK